MPECMEIVGLNARVRGIKVVSCYTCLKFAQGVIWLRGTTVYELSRTWRIEGATTSQSMDAMWILVKYPVMIYCGSAGA